MIKIKYNISNNILTSTKPFPKVANAFTITALSVVICFNLLKHNKVSRETPVNNQVIYN